MRRVQSVKKHPDFNENTMDNDLVIVELREPIEYSDTIQPITVTYFPGNTVKLLTKNYRTRKRLTIQLKVVNLRQICQKKNNCKERDNERSVPL